MHQFAIMHKCGFQACFAERQRWFHIVNCTQHKEGLFFLKKNFLLPAQCHSPLKKILCLENKGSINIYMKKKGCVCVCVLVIYYEGGLGKK